MQDPIGLEIRVNAGPAVESVKNLEVAIGQLRVMTKGLPADLNQWSAADKELGASLQLAQQELVNIKETTAATSTPFRNLSKDVSGLTQFYREHRSEQRQVSFYAREMKDALIAGMFGLQALQGAVGESTGAMKTAGQVIQQSTGAFIGFDFILSALGAPAKVALTVGGLAAIATAIFAIRQAAAQSHTELVNAELDLAKLKEKLGIGGAGATQYAMGQVLDDLKKKAQDMSGSWMDEAIYQLKRFGAMLTRSPVAMADVESTKTTDTSKEIVKNKEATTELTEAMRKHRLEMENTINTAQRWRDTINAMNTDADARTNNARDTQWGEASHRYLAQEHLDLQVLIDDWKKKAEAQFGAGTGGAGATGRGGRPTPEQERATAQALAQQERDMMRIAPEVTNFLKEQAAQEQLVGKYGQAFVDKLKAAETAAKILGGGLNNVWNGINQGFINVWNRTLGEAHSLFEQFLQGIVQAALQAFEDMIGQKILGGIIGLFTGGVGSLVGGAIGLASTPSPVAGIHQMNESAITSKMIGAAPQFVHVTGEFKQRGTVMVATINRAMPLVKAGRVGAT